MYYEVEMVSFVKEKESWDMTIRGKIETADRKMEGGNVLFKVSKYAKASKRYDEGGNIECDSFRKEEKKQAKTLKVTCSCSDAACKLTLKEYNHAEKLCTKVLDIESRNVDALYRRAQAYIEIANLDLTEFDMKKGS